MRDKIKLIFNIKTNQISLPCNDFSGKRLLELDNLKRSISENGILSPIIVRETAKGRYEVVCGRRRFMCARELCFKTVPCIKLAVDANDARLISLCETLSVKQPDYFSLAGELSEIFVNTAQSKENIRCRLGISERFLDSKLRLLKLSEITKQRISASGMSERQANELLRLPAEKHSAALDYIISNRLGDSETREYITSLLLPPDPEPVKPLRKTSISDLKLFSNSLFKLISTLQDAGYKPEFSSAENEGHIYYQIKVCKAPDFTEYYQMPLC